MSRYFWKWFIFLFYETFLLYLIFQQNYTDEWVLSLEIRSLICFNNFLCKKRRKLKHIAFNFRVFLEGILLFSAKIESSINKMYMIHVSFQQIPASYELIFKSVSILNNVLRKFLKNYLCAAETIVFFFYL